MAGLVIKPRARLFHGHDWVFASEILKQFGHPQDGEVVSLKDGRDRLAGSAMFNSRSQIVARRFSRQRQDLDADFFRRRIAQAVAWRERGGLNRDAARLVWSEADGLPGLIVDRYGQTLVFQTLTLAMDQRRELIVAALCEAISPQVIVERNDAPVRLAEGLELRTSVAFGNAAPVEVEAGGLRFTIDPLHGHKTGFYLDQVENYRAVAARANGRRVLDCFANQGAFALACARGGASEVTAVDISGEAVARIAANAERNQLAVKAVEANVFDFLKAEEARNSKYDLIILDPPSFTKAKGKVGDAMRGYKEIHLRALKLLAPDGLLATFSCSHHVTANLFQEMIVDALVDAKKSARIIARFSQAPDHPVLATMPETEYLKGLLLELAPGR